MNGDQRRTEPFRFLPPQPIDPVERIVPLALKIGLNVFLAVYLYQAAVAFIRYDPSQDWPFLLWVVRTTIFLPLHEGGHFLFMFFGRVLHSLGGSFWQIMFPFLSFLIGVRKRSTVIAPFALFWAGVNMMDVSLYMRDAPVRVLPLLGGNKSGHDWFFLLNQFDLMDHAGLIADITYYSGFLISLGSILAGTAFAVYRYINPVPLKFDQDED